jgi:hypothetical protein
MLFLSYYIVYTLSSTKLEIRAEQFLPGIEGVGRRRTGQVEGGKGEKWPKHCILI